MNRVPMILFWLTIGLVLVVGPLFDPAFPRWTAFGSDINLGWVALVLAAYNFVWWAGMRPWNAPKPRDDGPLPRPQPSEYHPEFDFNKPSDAIQERKSGQ